jgi:CPA2 family monovalent cation:H+ antiporter-2
MTLTPFLMSMSHKTSELLHKLPIRSQLNPKITPLNKPQLKLENHLIVIGYGVNGKNVSMAALNSSIPYAVIEIDPDMTDKEGEHFIYGDATQEYVLKKAQIQKAKIMVVAISDPMSTRRITELGKRINPELYVIVRTRYIDEIKILKNLGADEVIPEEFETSVEIFSRVLDKYNVSHDKIIHLIKQLREENYDLFQRVLQEKAVNCNIQDKIPSSEIILIEVIEKSSLEGLSKLDVEKKFNVKILSIIRNQKINNYPPDNLVLKKGDIINVSGLPEMISNLQNHIDK